jgi:hypothetical protein
MVGLFRRISVVGILAAGGILSAPKKGVELWAQKPVVRPEVPVGATTSTNPIDAFVAAELQKKGLQPAGPADKQALLRRVYLDLIGILPTPAQQDEFLKDDSPDAYEKLVDKLLASEQHSVRYGRHWLDVLRYADVDERMYAQPGIHLWRDWVIHALNRDMPYDQFVRAQLTGYRNERTQLSGIGIRARVDPRAEDIFALGFLARGGVVRDNKDSGELPIVAVETVSTAFMGLTVGCAKCHDHMYDPISQKDFYRMKALFDPLVVKKLTFATPAEILAAADAQEDAQKKRAAAEAPIKARMEAIEGPLRKKLEEERILMLPADAQAAVRKPEKLRSLAEQTLVDDYTVPLRVDPIKVREALPPDARKEFEDLEKKLNALGGNGGGGGGRRGGGAALPTFWTVEVDRGREKEPSYILSSGEVDRPEKDKPVEPGWPFAPDKIDFRDGRIEAFADWLTAPENPFFARVAVNRLWQWHFGEGLEKTPSDFGTLGGMPTNPKLLDWLASEFVARKFSMKEMHRLIVTSETYKRASALDPAIVTSNSKIDPADDYLWTFRLQRLEAEPVWDSILASAGTLDTSLGGASFDITAQAPRRGGGAAAGRGDAGAPVSANRRAAFMIRGFSTSRDVVPNFLQSFDVDDGRLPCPMRTRTVTAPQSLFLMNSEEVDKASTHLAERLQKESGGDVGAAVDLGYRITLCRLPSPGEKDQALTYVKNDPQRLKGLAWLLFNLDEFMYVR